MNIASASLHRRILWIALVILALSLVPVGAMADDPEPTTTPSEPPVVSDPSLAVEEAPESPTPGGPSAPAVVPDSAPVTSNSTISGIQGVVKLDVLVSDDRIRAGDAIVYTYVYTNTGSQPASGILIHPTWIKFYKTNRSGYWQYCDPSPCDVLNSQGPTVTRTNEGDNLGTGMEFAVGTLGAGQSGRFSIQLRTRPDIYPKTGSPPSRPAGSGRLYLNNNTSTPISEDTVSTLIEGPVFVLTKEGSPNNPSAIYPVDTTIEFVITLGNATGSGDIIDNQIRADAINATNVVLKDIVPSGAEYISSDPPAVYDAAKKELTWTFPTLNTGQSQEIRVRFRKLDVAQDCGRIRNSVYTVTSDQMPIKSGSERYTVNGKAVTLNVLTPLVVKSITSSPRDAIYGDEATLTIVVQNFYNQPINGAVLEYVVQSNAYYVPDSAVPAPQSAPAGTELGGSVKWTLNMPAGNAEAPPEATFTLRVRGGYTSKVLKGTGQAVIIAPDGVPSACIKARSGFTKLIPRLVLTKLSENDEYYVEVGQEYGYLVEVTNRGREDAIGVTIQDLLPASPANFSYVPGSATLDGGSREPDSVNNGGGGTLIWNNLTIPSGATIQLRYRLAVDGLEYIDYCNKALVVLNDESIAYEGNRVCVKINPEMDVIKTADVSIANPSQEVRFTLTVTNRSDSTYRWGSTMTWASSSSCARRAATPSLRSIQVGTSSGRWSI